MKKSRLSATVRPDDWKSTGGKCADFKSWDLRFEYIKSFFHLYIAPNSIQSSSTSLNYITLHKSYPLHKVSSVIHFNRLWARARAKTLSRLSTLVLFEKHLKNSTFVSNSQVFQDFQSKPIKSSVLHKTIYASPI